MDWLLSIQNFLLPPFLFTCFVCFISVFLTSSSLAIGGKKTLLLPPAQETAVLEIEAVELLQGQSQLLLCLWEDVPEAYLKGQSVPFLTPLACLFEDAPADALTGQSFELAYPLMTPFACVVTQTWQDYYRQELGKGSINYWQWRSLPEVQNVCGELTALLSLPQPCQTTRRVLNSLGRGKKPCYRGFRQQFWQQIYTYATFFDWHQTAVETLTKGQMQQIYKVCYRAPWQKVEKEIEHLNQLLLRQSTPWWVILNVSPKSANEEVYHSFKTLVKQWHPDLNPRRYAHHITARINLAYEQYQIRHEAHYSTPKQRQQRRNHLNELWQRLEKTIKTWLSGLVLL